MNGIVYQALRQVTGPRPRWEGFAKHNGHSWSGHVGDSVILEGNSQPAARELATRGYTRCRQFGILPSRKTPRWLLPLGDSEATTQSLGICAGYSRGARAMKMLLSVLVRMNWPGWARQRIALASKGPLALEQLVAEVTGETAPVFALSLGRPHRFHKATVQVMRPSGETLGYIKFPLTEAATERVRHEAEMLESLWGFAGLRPHIPRVLCASEWGDSYLLFQSGGPAQPGPVEFGRMHEEFLQVLQQVRGVKMPARTVTEEVGLRWQRLEPRLDAQLRQLGRDSLARARRRLDGSSVLCSIHHGDFAPWNTRVEGGQLFLFDWESASLEAPTSWDAFHFHAQVEGLLRKRNGRRSAAGKRESREPAFLLYLLNSLCQLLEEDPANRSGIEYRLKLLRESGH